MTVDTRYTPLASILQHVEGSKWTVNYYSQVLGADSELSPLQTALNPVYQQYELVQEMVLNVSTPLQHQQDEESKSSILTGSAVTYPGFIPNKGDMFLADIGDGREAILTVTTTEKLTHMRDAHYRIEYEVVAYASADEARVADLKAKTIKTYRYIKDFHTFGQNPKILTSDYEMRTQLQDAYQVLLGHYFLDFFSMEHQTLMVPGQEYTTYDPFLTSAVVDYVSTEDHPLLAKIRLPTVMGHHANAMPTLWDCLSQMSHPMLYTAMRQTRLLNTSYFKSYPQYSGIYFTGINRVVYPFDERTDVDADYPQAGCDPNLSTQPSLRDGGPRYTDFSRLIPSGELDGFDYTADTSEQLPGVIRVTTDNYYVLSESFYKGGDLKSHLERQVLAALKHQDLDNAVLLKLAQQAVKWGNVERYYYIPILFALLKVAIRTN